MVHIDFVDYQIVKAEPNILRVNKMRDFKKRVLIAQPVYGLYGLEL